MPGTLSRLRAATEDDVERALADAYVGPQLPTAAHKLEFFNRMVDVLTGEDARAMREDQRRVDRAKPTVH